MEKDVKVGDFGDFDLKLSGGKASLVLNAVVPGAALTVGASAVVDAAVLIDKLFAEIEAKSPAGIAPIEETVKMIVKNAVLAL